MREDLLHFIWKYKRLQLVSLETSDGAKVNIADVGTHNHLSGPDFFNAQIEIGGQLWAGNVEIHSKSSDWYLHRHEIDDAYTNVILHVVWEDDVSVFRKDGSLVPALELKRFINKELLNAYRKLFNKAQTNFINCEHEIGHLDSFLVENWLERMYFERLEQKSVLIHELLEKSNNDWERVLFILLLKNFGLNTNADSFLSLAMALDFSVVRKVRSSKLQLEALFLGMSHLLEKNQVADNYFLELQEEYAYLKKKFDLSDEAVFKPEFFRLRPSNFPTIRLSQLSGLYHSRQNIFNAIIKSNTIDELYDLFGVTASEYWNSHFTFGKKSKTNIKKTTTKFIDLLIINTVLPLKFCYAKHIGGKAEETLIDIITRIKPESNHISKEFANFGRTCKNAKESQALLQLYTHYCVKNKCMQCAIGSNLLMRK